MLHYYISFLLFLQSSINIHPIYLSNTEIRYNKKDQQLEISLKLFADDLEQAILNNYKKKVEIGTDRENKDSENLLLQYVQKNFKIFVNNKEKQMLYIGKENGAKNDFFAIFLYFEVKQVKSIKTIKIFNTLLIDENQNQLNFINCFTSKGLTKLICKKDQNTAFISW